MQIGVTFAFVDKTGAVVLRPRFDYVDMFSEGLAVARTRDRLGYIDRTGAYVWPPTG